MNYFQSSLFKCVIRNILKGEKRLLLSLNLVVDICSCGYKYIYERERCTLTLTPAILIINEPNLFARLIRTKNSDDNDIIIFFNSH